MNCNIPDRSPQLSRRCNFLSTTFGCLRNFSCGASFSPQSVGRQQQQRQTAWLGISHRSPSSYSSSTSGLKVTLAGEEGLSRTAGAMLRCLPLLKACNQQVDYIDKRHCNLFAVPDDVLRYTSTLEELMLDANQIRELPRVGDGTLW